MEKGDGVRFPVANHAGVSFAEDVVKVYHGRLQIQRARVQEVDEVRQGDNAEVDIVSGTTGNVYLDHQKETPGQKEGCVRGSIVG